jgi:hypothetical protein
VPDVLQAARTLDAEQQGTDLPGPAAFTAPPATDDELLPVDVLDLAPVR